MHPNLHLSRTGGFPKVLLSFGEGFNELFVGKNRDTREIVSIRTVAEQATGQGR